MFGLRTVSGKVSYTMVANYAFAILWLLTFIANGFGYSDFVPPLELVVIAPALLAIINLLLRYFRTREPISK